MTEEEIKEVAKPKAEAIIAREANLDAWYERTKIELERFRYSLEIEEKKVDKLLEKASAIQKNIENDGIEDQENVNKTIEQLKYINSRTERFKKKASILLEKEMILSLVADVMIEQREQEISRLQEEAARLQKMLSQVMPDNPS